MNPDDLVVHCKRTPYDVYVGRPSIWGNPFTIGADGTRDEVIARYEKWLVQQTTLIAQLPTLRGKVLACWCAPKEGFNGKLLCHGQILARKANAG